jgi:hypothetical protein
MLSACGFGRPSGRPDEDLWATDAPGTGRSLSAAGFEIVHHEEIAATADPAGTQSGIPAEWARHWPSERTSGTVRR